MKALAKKKTNQIALDVDALNQQFQPIIGRAQAAVDLAEDADRKLNEVLSEIYDFGKSLALNEDLARKFLEAHGQKYDAWAKKNIYQPLVQIAFAGRKLTAGALSQRSQALDIASREKPANVSTDVWLDENGGYKGVYDKFKGPSALDTLRKQQGGQIAKPQKPPLYDLHRTIKALLDFTLPVNVELVKKQGKVATRAFLIRNYEDSCRIDMVAVAHAFPCGRAQLASPIPGLGKGAFLLSDAQAIRFAHAFPKELGWTAAATAAEATFTSPSGVVIKAEEISLVPHADRLRACAQMRNHSSRLTLDASGIASFRNWQRVIAAEYAKRQAEMKKSWDHAESIRQAQQGGRVPVYGPKAPLPVPPLPAYLDLEANGGMTVGFSRANMPFHSPTFFLVSHMFGGGSTFAIQPERQLAVTDVERLCDVVSGLQASAIAAFADTDMDQAALCVDMLLDDDALRLVLPTVISAAGNYASACDGLSRIIPVAALPALPAQPQ